MFAYCNSNPISTADPTGHWPGITDKYNPNAMTYMSARPYSGESDIKRKEKLKKQGKKLFNANVDAALASDGYAFYKGVLIIKTDMFEKNVGFSLLMIFIGEGSDDGDLIHHEYGHRVHLNQIGFLDYLAYVVVPSVACYHYGVDYDTYYSLPWEYVADMLGKANRDDGGYIFR